MTDSALTPVELSSVDDLLTTAMSFEDWLRLMAALFTARRKIWWLIGDALVYGEQHFGEKYAQATALDEATGLSLESIRNAMWVSEHVPPDRRNLTLSWTHHQMVAGLDPGDQTRLLRQSFKQDWSTRDLRKKINDERDEGSPPRRVDDVPPPSDPDDQQEQPPPPNEDDNWRKLAEELVEENTRLEDQVASLKSSDKDKEIVRLHERAAALRGRLDSEIRKSTDLLREVEWYQKLLGSVRELIGAEHNNEILPKLTGMVE